MRQIILDTETTGLDLKSGHRVIEIGCIEVINRRITGKNFLEFRNFLGMTGKNFEMLED